jgi:hypothetical protein
MNNKFWDKFQSRLKLERSKKQKRKRRKSHKETEREQLPQTKSNQDVVAEKETGVSDLIIPGDEDLEVINERELQIDSLLHVLEEYLTTSVSTKNAEESGYNESDIDTLSNAVKKLKREMQSGLDIKELDSAETLVAADGEVTTKDIENVESSLQLAIQALDNLSRDVEDVAIENEKSEKNDEHHKEATPSENITENHLSQSSEEVDSSNLSEKIDNGLSPSVVDSLNNSEKEGDQGRSESQNSSLSSEVEPVELAEDEDLLPEPLEEKNSETSTEQVESIDIVSQEVEEECDQPRNEQHLSVDSKSNNNAFSSGTTDDANPHEDLDVLLPISSKASQPIGEEENNPKETNRKVQSSQDWKAFSGRRRRQDDSEKDSLEQTPGTTVAEDRLVKMEVSPYSGENDENMSNKKWESRNDFDVFRREHHDESPTKEKAKSKLQSLRERYKDKKREKRMIKYDNELALIEESMKKERPKFKMKASEVNLASKMIKRLKVLVLQEVEEEEAPNSDPMPPLLAAAAAKNRNQ